MNEEKKAELKKAYKLVLKDLKKSTRCEDEDYAIGCYGCGLRLVYKTLDSIYDFEFKAEPQ